jgi:hypothetical protein
MLGIVHRLGGKFWREPLNWFPFQTDCDRLSEEHFYEGNHIPENKYIDSQPLSGHTQATQQKFLPREHAEATEGA